MVLALYSTIITVRF